MTVGNIQTLGLLLQIVSDDLPVRPRGQPKVHNGSWFDCLDMRGDVREDLRHATVLEILQQNPTIIQELANARDNGGRRAMDITDAVTKQILLDHLYFCGRYEIQVGPPMFRTATSFVVRARDHVLTARYNEYFHQSNGLDVDNNCGTLNQSRFVACVNQLCDEFNAYREEEELRQYFTARIGSAGGEMGKEDFVQYCVSAFGSYRDVWIQFMKNQVWPIACHTSSVRLCAQYFHTGFV